VHSEPTVHDLVHDGVHEFLHLDGKIFQTLKLLVTKPGALTREYLAGRRARYISPLRLYLTFSVLYFALVALSPGTGNLKVTSDDISTPKAREEIERVQERLPELRAEIPHQMARVMFLLMPGFALLTWGFYRRSQRYYVSHLYYSIHFHAFVFLIFTLGALLGLTGRIGAAVGSMLSLGVFPYHYVALRRVFGGTRGQTAWKGTAIGVIYALLAAVVLGVVMWLVIRSALRTAPLHAA